MGPATELGVELPPGAHVFLRMGAISKARVRGELGQTFDFYERRYGKIPGALFKRDDDAADLTVIASQGQRPWRMLKVNRDEERPGHMTVTIFRR